MNSENEFTDASIEKLPIPKLAPYELGDGTGLRVCVSPSGPKTFVGRVTSLEKAVTLGDWSLARFTVEQARAALARMCVDKAAGSLGSAPVAEVGTRRAGLVITDEEGKVLHRVDLGECSRELLNLMSFTGWIQKAVADAGRVEALHSAANRGARV